MDTITAAKRLKQLRENSHLSHESLSDILDKRDTPITRTMLINYEAAARSGDYNTKSKTIAGMSAKNLCALADVFGVSTDYILGRTEVASPDTDLHGVCDYTGLSEESVKVLHHLKNHMDPDKLSLSAVGLVIINKFISELKRAKGSKTEEDYEALTQFLYDYLFVMWSARNIAKEENATLIRREITFGDDYEATISMRDVYDFKRDDIKKRVHSFADRIIEEETDKVIADAECKKQKGEYTDTDKTRKECKNDAEEQP